MAHWIIVDAPGRYAAGTQFTGTMIDRGTLPLTLTVVEISDDWKLARGLGPVRVVFRMLDQRKFGERDRPLWFAGSFDRPDGLFQPGHPKGLVTTPVDGYFNTRMDRMGEMWAAGTARPADTAQLLYFVRVRDVLRGPASQVGIPEGSRPDPLNGLAFRPG